MTVQDIQDSQMQITCADVIEFTAVKNTLIKAGLTWVFEPGTDVIQVFKDGDFIGDKDLDPDFGTIISAQEFLKRFVY